jgi:hypothetical protein
MEAGVKFVAADMPEVNETMLHFMSVIAQHEAKAISLFSFGYTKGSVVSSLVYPKEIR